MFRRVIRFFWNRRVEQDLDAELQSTVELLAAEHIRAGASPQDALRLARLELGGIEQVKEEVRSARGLAALDSVIRDLRHALRDLIRAPGFSLSVVVTLGLALGANAAVLSLLDKLILRPLPVSEPSRLAAVIAPPLPVRGRRPEVVEEVVETVTANGRASMSYPLYAALRSRVRAFAGMLAKTHAAAILMAEDTPVAVNGVLVTGNYFEVLGVKAAIGRVLTPGDDEQPPGTPVVVLSHGFWQRQFGGDPSILNRTIRLNLLPMTVVGVTAPGFTGTTAGATVDFFSTLSTGRALLELPAVVKARFRFDSPDYHIYSAMARLAPGMDLKQAEQAADQVYQQLITETLGGAPRGRFAQNHVQLFPGGYASSDQSALSRDLHTPLLLLMGMVGLVLVIAAGNVANLFLARGEARSREIAIRFALGASRWRVLRAFLVECLLLTLTAGSAGLLLARWTAGLAPVVLNIERLPDGVTPAPDSRIGVAVLLLSLAVGFAIWAASAPRVVGRAAGTTFASQIQTGACRALHWRRLLVVAQAALSIVLLCGSAVLSRSLIRLMSVDPGFSVDHLYSFWLDPGRAGYGPVRSGALMAQVLDRLGEMPGVKSASIATDLPLGRDGMGTVVNPDHDREVGVEVDIVGQTPGHFANLGVPITAGREFSRDDLRGAKVAVVNESLARKLFGRNDPVGRHIGLDGGSPDWLVVGVVKDIRPGPRVPAGLKLFRPFNFQDPARTRAGFVLRAEKNVRLTSEMVRTLVRRIEPAAPVGEFGSMSGQAAQALYRDRMLAWLSLCFAVVAALLCAIGIFGLTNFSVARRAHEIGIRIALGASPRSIQWIVMREVSLLATLGCALGLMIFLFAGRVLSAILFDLTPSDPASLAIGPAILCGAAFLAGFLPAHRAARLDPIHTLRRE